MKKNLIVWSLSCLGLSGAIQAQDLELTRWESLQENEKADTESLKNMLIDQLYKDYVAQNKRVLRDAHPKALGCTSATFEVLSESELISNGLPKDKIVGVFQPGKSYDAIIRFSNASGKVKSDAEGDGRGMAIKLLGVEGKKLVDDQGQGTHDFIMINMPVFPIRDVNGFLKLTSAAFEGNPMGYFFPSANPLEWRLKDLRLFLKLSSSKPASVLSEQYFSMSPYLLKDQPIKFSAKPCETHDFTRPSEPGFDYLTEQLDDYLATNSACFDFMVQLRKSDEWPIEDPREEWPQSPGLLNKTYSPYVKVARVTINSQQVNEPNKLRACDNLSFNPWRALPEHRPLGSINRSRRVIYKEISDFRHEKNMEVWEEPTDLRDFE